MMVALVASLAVLPGQFSTGLLVRPRVFIESAHPSRATASFSPDGKWVVFSGWNRTLVVCEVVKGRPAFRDALFVTSRMADGSYPAAAISNGGTRIAVENPRRQVDLFNRATLRWEGIALAACPLGREIGFDPKRNNGPRVVALPFFRDTQVRKFGDLRFYVRGRSVEPLPSPLPQSEAMIHEGSILMFGSERPPAPREEALPAFVASRLVADGSRKEGTKGMIFERVRVEDGRLVSRPLLGNIDNTGRWWGTLVREGGTPYYEGWLAKAGEQPRPARRKATGPESPAKLMGLSPYANFLVDVGHGVGIAVGQNSRGVDLVSGKTLWQRPEIDVRRVLPLDRKAAVFVRNLRDNHGQVSLQDASTGEWFYARSGPGKAMAAVTPDGKTGAMQLGDQLWIFWLDNGKWRDRKIEGWHEREPMFDLSIAPTGDPDRFLVCSMFSGVRLIDRRLGRALGDLRLFADGKWLFATSAGESDGPSRVPVRRWNGSRWDTVPRVPGLLHRLVGLETLASN